MDLKTYLTPLDAEAREKFASLCGTSVGHLQNVMYGVRHCAPGLAVLIERHSGTVRRWELRPDDWFLIWPELIGAKGAPRIPAGDLVKTIAKPNTDRPVANGKPTKPKKPRRDGPNKTLGDKARR